MATSFVGPALVARAFSAAPVPRLPAPTRAMRMVSSEAAWTAGMATPASAETAATLAVVWSTSRRVGLPLGSLTVGALRGGMWGGDDTVSRYAPGPASSTWPRLLLRFPSGQVGERRPLERPPVPGDARVAGLLQDLR